MEIDFPLVDNFRGVDIVAVVVVVVRVVAVRVVAVRVVAVCDVVRDVPSVLAEKNQLSIQYFHQPNFHQFFEIICHFFPKAFSC